MFNHFALSKLQMRVDMHQLHDSFCCCQSAQKKSAAGACLLWRHANCGHGRGCFKNHISAVEALTSQQIAHDLYDMLMSISSKRNALDDRINLTFPCLAGADWLVMCVPMPLKVGDGAPAHAHRCISIWQCRYAVPF